MLKHSHFIRTIPYTVVVDLMDLERLVCTRTLLKTELELWNIKTLGAYI